MHSSTLVNFYYFMFSDPHVLLGSYVNKAITYYEKCSRILTRVAIAMLNIAICKLWLGTQRRKSYRKEENTV